MGTIFRLTPIYMASSARFASCSSIRHSFAPSARSGIKPIQGPTMPNRTCSYCQA
jgi:hypothetical protein